MNIVCYGAEKRRSTLYSQWKLNELLRNHISHLAQPCDVALGINVTERNELHAKCASVLNLHSFKPPLAEIFMRDLDSMSIPFKREVQRDARKN